MFTLAVRVLVTIILISCLSSHASSVSEDLASAARASGVPPKILRAVCFVESSHRNVKPRQDGKTKSYGICQVKWATAEYIDRKYHMPGVSAEALDDVWVNAQYAALYLRSRYEIYGDWVKAIDAYNKGSLKSENSQYVKRVLAYMDTE